jgi:hypothetical protein
MMKRKRGEREEQEEQGDSYTWAENVDKMPDIVDI